VATLPSSVRVFAPAKINLFLHVTHKRSDGFHDLQSLAAFAAAGDILAIESGSGFALETEGPFADGLAGEKDNLVLRAASALAGHLGSSHGARFTLTKNLPVASGIGGGSADAAAAMRGLLALWGFDAEKLADLGTLAAGLGSDIPVCLASQTSWMEGRGERLRLLPSLPPTDLVLVNPGVSVATAEVFRRLTIGARQGALAPPDVFRSRDALVSYLATTRNDLEEPALALVPIIGDVLDALSSRGASLARMSGSGATCFGLFESHARAADAAAALKKAEAGWWTCATRFADSRMAQPVIEAA
jgi:4-diphosphocytidyl-2-C-methyl-D-erythritol kinase